MPDEEQQQLLEEEQRFAKCDAKYLAYRVTGVAVEDEKIFCDGANNVDRLFSHFEQGFLYCKDYPLEKPNYVTARTLLTDIGFDSDNINKQCMCKRFYPGGSQGSITTPLIYFCHYGNINMCHYLLSRGADVTESTQDGRFFPLMAAARGGHFNVCKLLFDADGATDAEFARQTIDKDSPLCNALHFYRISTRTIGLDIALWILLNDSNLYHTNTVRMNELSLRTRIHPSTPVNYHGDTRPKLLAWARIALRNHEHVKLFLKGTLVPPSWSSSSLRQNIDTIYETRSTKRRKQLEVSSSSSISPLLMFTGKSGILKLIGDFAGNPIPKDVRSLRQFVTIVSDFIEDTPWDPSMFDDYDGDY